MNWTARDRLMEIIIALERGTISRTIAAADLRRILASFNLDK